MTKERVPNILKSSSLAFYSKPIISLSVTVSIGIEHNKNSEYFRLETDFCLLSRNLGIH